MTPATAYITACATTGTPISLAHVAALTGLTGLRADRLVRRTVGEIARSRAVRSGWSEERRAAHLRTGGDDIDNRTS